MPPNSPIISWAITDECNARPLCKYCIARINKFSENSHFDSFRINEIISGINRLNPRIIYINGGEPFTVPNFIKQVVMPLFETNNKLFITSNFLASIDEYSAICNLLGTNLEGLNLSYHVHLFPDFKKFIRKINQLKERIDDTDRLRVSAVLHPNYLKRITEFNDKLLVEAKIQLYPQFYKTHNDDGIREIYPYNGVQMKIIEQFKQLPNKSYPLKTEGIMCWSGTKYLFIDQIGNVYRCQMYYEKQVNNPLGKIREFELIGSALTCDFSICGCGSAQESGALVEDKK